MSPITKPPSAAKYPGLSRITDPDVHAVAKILFDLVGGLQQQVPQIGTVSQPLTDHLDSNGKQLKAVADPTAPQDAVTLKFLQHYVEARTQAVKTDVLNTVSPASPPPSQGPIIPNPPPTPLPPPPSPPGTGTFSATDMLDLHTVIILASPADIATWPQAATLTNFDFQQTGVFVDFTKKTGAGRWPDVIPPGFEGPIEYTLWGFWKVAGQWYGAGFIQFWFGLDRNGGPPSGMAVNWTGGNKSIWAPMGDNQPAVGDQVGFMLSAGNARLETDVSSVKERTQTILIPMPSDSGAVYT